MMCISKNWSEADSGELPELLPSEANQYAGLPFHLLQKFKLQQNATAQKKKISKPKVILSHECIEPSTLSVSRIGAAPSPSALLLLR
jgi:hypothetical protein